MRIILPLGIAFSAAMFFGSLFLQHVMGFQPCAWCIVQRCAALVAFLGMSLMWLSNDDLISTLWSSVAKLGLFSGISAAGYQTYMGYLANAQCGDWLGMKLGFFTMDYPMTAWLLEPTALCTEANTVHFGLFLSEWSMLVFIIALVVHWMDWKIVIKS